MCALANTVCANFAKLNGGDKISKKCIEAKDCTFTNGFATKDADKSKNEKSSSSHFNSYAKRP